MTDNISSSSQAAIDGGLASHQQTNENSFGEVFLFVERHSKLVVLTDENSGALIAVWPAMQGRVLTSSAAGENGFGYGWVNRELIASGKIAQHMNAVGGEDRIWLGPEDGQFSIFFAPGVPYHGDVANTYNDGPAAPGGGQLGHFYELESSSPARELKSNEALGHTHRTLHFEGTELQLDAICQRTLGVRLADVRSFNP